MFDSSWQALLQPGKAEAFFTLAKPPPFRPDAEGFDLGNAWWLAELSRLVYSDMAATRRAALAKVGLAETGFFDRGATQCALVQPTGPADPFTVLVFRGSSELRDWLTNLGMGSQRWPPGGRVHRGFVRALMQVWPLLGERLQGCPRPLFVTGHSLGGALSMLAGSLLQPRAVYTFGAPRVGDADFAATLRAVAVFRIVNRGDLVVAMRMPGLRQAGRLYQVHADGRLLVDGPDEAPPGAAVQPRDRRWYHPASFLADHSPVNYVTALQQLL